MDDSAIIWDEVIDVNTKLNDEAKLNDKETKTFPTSFNEKK